jgi:poly-gamma-glutamate synthesis protein (capsule biosynthesis protein)
VGLVSATTLQSVADMLHPHPPDIPPAAPNVCATGQFVSTCAHKSCVTDPSVSRVTVVAVGDLQLGDSAIGVGFGFRSACASGDQLARALDGVRPQLADADVVFGNLECTLSEQGLEPSLWRSVQMRGVPAFAKALRQTGFNVLNVANNHANQHGEAAFLETVELLRAEGIVPCGVRGQGPWQAEPAYLATRDGSRVGVLGYSRRPRQYGDGTPPYAEGTDDEICADVRRLKASVPYVIVSLHWGEEFVTRPSQAEVGFAHRLLDAGASLVVGHHPHVLRPVEETHVGVVAYSLGNFVGDMVWYPEFRRGAILRCVLAAGGVAVESVTGTFLDEAFRPQLVGDSLPEVVTTPIDGLDPVAYGHEVRRTTRRQRLAAYRYAAANALRYPPAFLAQLVVRTVRGKVLGVFE